jgi:hypothetical protein
VRNLHLSTKNGTVTLLIESELDADLEIWAVGEVASAFRGVYGLNVAVQRGRTP